MSPCGMALLMAGFSRRAALTPHSTTPSSLESSVMLGFRVPCQDSLLRATQRRVKGVAWRLSTQLPPASATIRGVPAVICRFRHTPTGYQPRERGRPSSRRREWGEVDGRRFGGDEFGMPWETSALNDAVLRLGSSSGVLGHMMALGTDEVVAQGLVNDFIRECKSGKIKEVSPEAIGKMADQALEVGMTFKSMGTTREDAVAPALDKTLWDTFLVRYQSRFPPEVAFRISKLRDIADMRYPTEWNPETRLMKRKVIMHVGPTNSGKTYNALMRLQQAEKGVYLSPLRLLAHEVYERMNNAGAKCNLVTGEERRFAVYKPDGTPDPTAAGLVSCTVEMADTKRKVDVAVLDEIQMIADQDRGWAWTFALMGLPAQEVHLCGEPTVVELVRKICKLTNDDFEVKRYDRLSKLELQEKSINGRLDQIRKGDCLVTFSRKNIFLAKKAIEDETGLRCAVAYGSLPPESRSMQAKLFNDPNSGYDVLVASDAIGMGLNLNIRRVIFEAVQKFDGTVIRLLSLTQLKQIAGRAGRFGTEYAVGQATTLMQRDIPVLKRALAAPMIDIHRAALQPTVEMIERFSHYLPGAPFSEVLKTFEKFTQSSDLFFPGPLRNMIAVAQLLDNIPMNLNDRYPFISGPIQIRDKVVVPRAILMAKALSNETPISIDELVILPEETVDPGNLKLQLLESDHRTIMLYLWLGQRFEHIYQGGIDSLAYRRKLQCERLIEAALKQHQSKRLLKQLLKKERAESKKLESELKVGSAKSAKGASSEKSGTTDDDVSSPIP
ncbi:RNA helicase [Actinomortierella ambigua]|uniref:RNA helicase n=1 Tax=Actinomortierella ambigua TaxID=1343610 RepID=A0A9P6UD89_9FUNG|nr:RNA helicase [Actinomortierella ambigua]